MDTRASELRAGTGLREWSSMGRSDIRSANRAACRAALAIVLLLMLGAAEQMTRAQLEHPAPGGAPSDAFVPARPLGGVRDALPRVGTALTATGPVPTNSSVTWLNITGGLAQGPSARSNASAAYDSQDNLLLLYGGENHTAVLSDTWEFSGGAWTLVAASSGPGPRYGAGLTYDPTDHYFVLFGGNTSNATATRTWFFEGGHWVLDPSNGQPRPREFPAFAYDPAAAAVVLFGGTQAGNQSGVVWWLTQGNWTQQTVGGPGTPSHRAGAAFFWYQNSTTPADSGMVLFGGYSTDPGTAKVFRDTWIYGNANGTYGWTLLSFNSPPTARFDPAVSLDPVTAATLMFGGFGSNGAPLGDLWSYNASGWTASTLGGPSHPAARGGAAMSLAPVPGRPSIPYADPASPLLTGGVAQSGLDLSDSWFAGPLPLSLLAPVVPQVSDVGTAVQLSVDVFGQGAPITVMWSGLPSGCTGSNRTAITCEPNQVGGQTVSVTISTGSLTVTSGSSNWTVNSLPRISIFTVLPSPTLVGKGTTIQVGVAAGSGTAPFTYQYLGLPDGCSSSNLPRFVCSPVTAGSFEIEVIVQDADGQSTSALTNLTVSASEGGGAAPLWEYAAEGLGILLVVLFVIFIVRGKAGRGRPPSGTVRRWKGPPTTHPRSVPTSSTAHATDGEDGGP